MTGAARFTKRLVGTLALAGFGFLGGSIARARWFDASTTPAPRAALAIDQTADLIAGRPAAPVTVRIFGDYECPACRQLEQTLGDTLLALADAGRIRLIYLHRPLAARRDPDIAAALVACEPDARRRWQLHRALYQPIVQSAGAGPATVAERAILLARADSSRLACVHSDSARAHAQHAIASARSAGFHEVPTVLVNDRRVHFRTHAALLRHLHRILAGSS